MTTKPIFNLERRNIRTDTLTDKCIVLDLDSTLINTVENDDDGTNFLSRSNINGSNVTAAMLDLRNRIYKFDLIDIDKRGEGVKQAFWGVFRPGLKNEPISDDNFVDFCFKYFKYVIVYSAGVKSYVQEVVKKIFNDEYQKPHAIFSFGDVVLKYDTPEDEREKNDNFEIIKPLTKIINSHEIFRRDLNLSNMLALDDLESTFSENDDNGILIPRYEPSNLTECMKKDTALRDLKNWLNQDHVRYSNDVRDLTEKRNFLFQG